MSVFDSTTKVSRTLGNSATDDTLPGSASLSWRAINSAQALGSQNATECELLHGDHSRHITGNRTENIDSSSKHTVDGDQTIRINGKHKETIVLDCYENIIGPHVVLNQTVRNETHLGTRTLVYGAFLNKDDASGDLQYASSLFEHTNVFNFEWSSSKLEVQPLHVEVKGLHVEGELIEINGALAGGSDHEYRLLDEKVTAKLEALINNIVIARVQLGALQGRLGMVITPIDGNGTPGF
jgi:hypothetical protein